MLKIYKIIIFLILISLPTLLSAHVQHYENLNRIEFDIYRNNKHIGKHIFSFETEDGYLAVKSEINFEIKKLGISLYKYHVKGKEIYKDGKLVKFNSKTDQNGKLKYVNLTLENDEFLIDGSSYKGKAPQEYLLGTWWNHSITKAKAITKDRLRAERKPLLEAQDVLFMKAQEAGTSTTAIVTEKQRLRDITNQVDSMTTTTQLRAATVTE